MENDPVFNTKLIEPNNQEWLQCIDRMESEQVQVLVSGDVEQNWNGFKSLYAWIEAAGGLVKNQNNEWLVIHRNGTWDLPKGKLETNEDIEHCAVREVAEECGISEPQIFAPIHPTYHTYILNGQRILKKTHWYLMRSADASELTPQTEEGITDVRWVNENGLLAMTKDSFGSIQDVVESGLKLRDR